MDLPIYSLFIFLLIISSNFLGTLFPCKFQKLLLNNVYAKYVFAFLTLFYFVILVNPVQAEDINTSLCLTFFIFVLFILLIKTNVIFFIICLIILAANYFIHIREKEERSKKGGNIQLYSQLNQGFNISFIACTIIGFLSYMGEKKIEYKDKFNYFTFIFGKPVCGDKYNKSEISFTNSLKAAFQ